MEPIYKDLELSEKQTIPVDKLDASDYWSRKLAYDSVIGLPDTIQAASTDTAVSDNIVVEAAGGLKLWHLLVAVGVFLLLRKK